MTPADFERTSIALLRSAIGWQSAITRRLGVDPRTVRRWLKSEQLPVWVAGKPEEWAGVADITAWPRDEWLIGEALGGDRRRRE
ncbi:MAG TPA: hypothetical protein PKD55_21790 [Bellilinea sp.]|nr:hypothetical protein [Bellilinea sp.]